MNKKVRVQATINAEDVEFLCEPRQSLLEVLRDTPRIASSSGKIYRACCPAMWFLHPGLHRGFKGIARSEPKPERKRSAAMAGRESVSLHGL